MLILIGIVPATYALDMTTTSEEIAAMVEAAKGLERELSHPQIVEVMEALRGEHLATTRVEQLRIRDLARTEAVGGTIGRPISPLRRGLRRNW